MFFIRIQCPHCNEPHTVQLFAASEYTADCLPSQLAKEQMNTPAIEMIQRRVPAQFSAAGTCSSCGRPVLLELDVDRYYLQSLREYISNPEHRYNGPAPQILHVWPEPATPYAHPSLPEQIRKDFISLQLILPQMANSPWMGISACRTILESAVKHLGGEGRDLYGRIRDLAQKGILSGVMADWADVLRLLGNEAVHETAGTFAEVQELVEFTKLFLQYTFELPAKVKDARAVYDAKKKAH